MAFPVFSPFLFSSHCLYAAYVLVIVLSLALSNFSCVHLLPDKYTLHLLMTLFKHSRFLCCSMPSFDHLIGTLVLFWWLFFPRPSLLLRRSSYPKKPKMSDVMEMVGVPNWGHVRRRFILGICRIVKGIHTLRNHRWEHLDSDEKKPLAEVSAKSSFTYNEGKAVYISVSGLFMSLGDLRKLPALVLCLREPPGGFSVADCCCFPYWRFLRFRITFPCHRHSILASQVREGLHQLWALPWLLSVALLLPGFSVTVLPRALRLWTSIFYPQAFFTLRSFSTFLVRFVTMMRAGTLHLGTSSLPALTELFLPADAWTWTTHIVVTRPLIYQLRQRDTKDRVKIELLNMFRLFKV